MPISNIGPAMGKSRQYFHSLSGNNSTPRCDTMATMLDLFGYGLCAMPYEEIPEGAIRLEVPDAGHDAQREYLITKKLKLEEQLQKTQSDFDKVNAELRSITNRELIG